MQSNYQMVFATKRKLKKKTQTSKCKRMDQFCFFLFASFPCARWHTHSSSLATKLNWFLPILCLHWRPCAQLQYSHACECHCRLQTWSPRHICIDSICTIQSIDVSRANIFNSSSMSCEPLLLNELMNWIEIGIEISMNLCVWVSVCVCEWNKKHRPNRETDMVRNELIVSNVHQDTKCALTHSYTRREIEWLRCSWYENPRV